MKLFNRLSITILIITLIGTMFLPWIRDNSILDGIGFFTIGWFFIFQGCLLWLTFPFIIFAADSLLKERYYKALILSIISTLMGLEAIIFQGKTISFIDSNASFGTLAIGYYAWIITLIIFTFVCFLNFKKSNEILKK